MVGWAIFHDHNPESFGNVGQSMVTMFVLLTLENLLFFISYVLIASFLIFNLFIGIVINSMEGRARSSCTRPSARSSTGTTPTTSRRTR